MEDAQRFVLAPMSPLMWGLTLFCWAIPTFFFLSAFLNPIASPIALVGALMVIIYATVWVWWRPSAFVVTPDNLELQFPVRKIVVPRDQIENCKLWSGADLKARYGATYRVGAGGLWGGFGWLRSSSKEWIEFYISRQSDYLYIERHEAIPLLLTPSDREDMLAALQSH